MQFKLDTKEKFTTITPIEAHLYDNMAAEFAATCTKFLESDTKNVILNLQPVTAVDDSVAEAIAQIQQQFYEANNSFVICEMKPDVEAVFDKLELLEMMNVTPTESEAWDIVQMEEIERELMDGDDVNFEMED